MQSDHQQRNLSYCPAAGFAGYEKRGGEGACHLLSLPSLLSYSGYALYPTSLGSRDPIFMLVHCIEISGLILGAFGGFWGYFGCHIMYVISTAWYIPASNSRNSSLLAMALLDCH